MICFIYNVAEHDQLFYLAYERVKVDEGKLEPHLWSFRSRITVDHLRSSLMQQKKISVKILDAFLQDVSLVVMFLMKNYSIHTQYYRSEKNSLLFTIVIANWILKQWATLSRKQGAHSHL